MSEQSDANLGEGLMALGSDMLFQNRDHAAMQRAKRLRRDMTDGEKILWGQLRRGVTGFWFRRQFPSGPYVLDFYCATARLCIEIDGEQHSERIAQDARRDAYFAGLGIETLRVGSMEVFDNIDGVVDEIVRTC